jgi:hypothetical protein
VSENAKKTPAAAAAASVRAEAELVERVFSPAADVNSVQFGADPHVVLKAGERFATSDPIVAAELAENPFLEEVASR